MLSANSSSGQLTTAVISLLLSSCTSRVTTHYACFKTISRLRVTRPQISWYTLSVWSTGTDIKEGMLQLDPNVSASADEAAGWHSVTIAGDINQHSRSERESRMQRSHANILNRASTGRDFSSEDGGEEGLPLSEGCQALWENGHANEGQIHREQLHWKWADFVLLGLAESLKCCLLIKGGKTERNKRLKIVTEKLGAADDTHRAVIIAMKRLPLLLFTLWR